jgi:HD-like signal output (HDOD) protein
VYAETLAYGLDHAALGAQLLRDWELPAQIIEAVATHHRPENSQSDLGAVLCVAEDVVAQTSPMKSEDLWPSLRRTAACFTLKITPAELDEFLRDSSSCRESA